MSRRQCAYHTITGVAMTERPPALTGNKRVTVPHNSGDAPVPFGFPCSHRELAIPCHKQLLLLACHRQVVPIVHVKIDTSDLPFDRIAGLCCSSLKIHLKVARAMLISRGWQDPEIKIGAISVHFPDRRRQIVQIRFHHIEHRINPLTIGSATVLPALP